MGESSRQVSLGDLIIHQDGDPGVISAISDTDIEVDFLSGAHCVFDVHDVCGEEADIAFHFPRHSRLSSDEGDVEIVLRNQLLDLENLWHQLKVKEKDLATNIGIAKIVPWLERIEAVNVVNAYDALVSNRQNFKKTFVEEYHCGSLRNFLLACNSAAEVFDVEENIIDHLRRKKTRSILKSAGFEGMDPFQLEACSKLSKNHLIKARAGSGKTLCVTALAILALKDSNIPPNQVMVLTFNRRAAREVGARIQRNTNSSAFGIARTFHSLAKRISRPKKQLIFDDGGLDISGHKQSRFADRVVKRILNPAFKLKLFLYFRKELEDLEKLGAGLSSHDYFLFRRSLLHFTLNGEKVKSIGEKYIADFLFEREIDYVYEKVWDWKFEDGERGIPYAPDFSINYQGRDFILEHWAVHPDDRDARLPDWWEGGDAKEYQQQIHRKRRFWRERNVALIETDTSMLAGGREAFERMLEQQLMKSGIRSSRQSQDRIIKRVLERPHQISRMARTFLAFVQKCKKRSWAPGEMAKIIEERGPYEERTRIFYDLAIRFYREYEKTLDEEGAIDFDDLLHLAIEEINRKTSDASFYTEDRSIVHLKDLQLLLIDEFQDVSPLYVEMINSIRAFNPELEIVCVGDDWQAINKFAGSDLRFFSGFKEHFTPSEVSILPVNHRSAKNIVALGNYVMRGNGEEGIARTDSGLGNIVISSVEDIFVSFSKRADLVAQSEKDRPYVENAVSQRADADRGWLTGNERKFAASLKAATEFIREVAGKAEDADDQVESVLVLSRTKHVYGINIREFSKRLRNCLQAHAGASISNALTVSSDTVHAAKGEGADVVVILDATGSQFPKVHPDLTLFSLFDEGVSQNLEEERRLFYVSVTRCKRHLLVLTSRKDSSPFIPDMNTLSTVQDVSSVDLSESKQEDLPTGWEANPDWIVELAKHEL